MTNFVRIFFKYFYLIVLAFFFECIFNKIELNAIYNLIENTLFAIALICPLYFINKTKIYRFYFIVSYLVFSFCINFETVFYYIFKTSFSSSAIFVVLDTNITESKEFMNFYMDVPIVLFTIIIFFATLMFVLKLKSICIESIVISRARKIKVLSLFMAILFFLKLSTLIVFNVPYIILKSSKEYYSESKKLNEYKTNKFGHFNNVSRVYNQEEKEVYVIVIGESTSKSHMGIYNYYRETTPNLSDIKDELLIYNNVISPHAYSVGALTKTLTMGNYENPNLIANGSIIQLMNSVGFETYWLSNQRPIGPFESMITKIALSSKNHRFLTTTLARNSKVLDGELLLEYEKLLKQDSKKKIIFIHLMGTHHDYDNRYPETFNKFVDQPETKFKSKENFIKINQYDNAILYNDFVISEIIKKLKSLNIKSFVLYFSDHGEEMFDAINFAGHNEDIYSKKMFEVPFFIWQSHNYKKEQNLLFLKNRQYMMDDLFHSIADLVDVKANEVDSTRSIFSKHFKERKRIIKDTINFDAFYN